MIDDKYLPRIEYNVKIGSHLPQGLYRPNVKINLSIDCRNKNINHDFSLGNIMFVPYEVINILLEYKNKCKDKAEIDYTIQKIDTEIDSKKITYYKIDTLGCLLCYLKPFKLLKKLAYESENNNCNILCYHETYDRLFECNLYEKECGNAHILAIPYKTTNDIKIITLYHDHHLYKEHQYPFYNVNDEFGVIGKRILCINTNEKFNNENYIKFQINNLSLQWRPIPNYDDIVELFTKVPYVILNEYKSIIDFSPESKKSVNKIKKYHFITKFVRQDYETENSSWITIRIKSNELTNIPISKIRRII